MFTGIVTAVGRIDAVTCPDPSPTDAGVRVKVQVQDFLRDTTRPGDSIAINGACMTVVERGDDWFAVDISRESLNKTVGLDTPGNAVNLEHAMRLGDSLDGHMVLGHVDGVGEIARFAPVGESWELQVRVPGHLAHYMAYKGSVTINGVSLTVNRVEDHADTCIISINVIPHTLEQTNLKHLKDGHKVNLEADPIARYVDRLAQWSRRRGQ